MGFVSGKSFAETSFATFSLFPFSLSHPANYRLPSPSTITSPTTMSTAELACSYAALILADDGVEVTVRSLPSI